MRKPLTVIIVTLSLVCTVVRQSIQRIKAMLLCIEYGTLYLICHTVNMKIKACNALYAMFVTLSILVFVSLTQHLIQSTMRCENSTLLCIKWPLTPARREGYLLQYSIWKAFCLGGLAVHQSEEAALFTFLDLSNYKGDCRQDAQPIPNA